MKALKQRYACAHFEVFLNSSISAEVEVKARGQKVGGNFGPVMARKTKTNLSHFSEPYQSQHFPGGMSAVSLCLQQNVLFETCFKKKKSLSLCQIFKQQMIIFPKM